MTDWTRLRADVEALRPTYDSGKPRKPSLARDAAKTHVRDDAVFLARLALAGHDLAAALAAGTNPGRALAAYRARVEGETP